MAPFCLSETLMCDSSPSDVSPVCLTCVSPGVLSPVCLQVSSHLCVSRCPLTCVMSLSSADLLDLLDQWEELKDLNLSDPNVTRVDATVCSGTVGHASLLYVLSIFYLFIFLVGIASNALVVWVNLRSNRKCSDVFVLQLAAADLVAVATLPVQVGSMLIGRWPFGAVLCKLTHLVFSVNLFSSILFLTCMSVERYLSVTLPPGGRRELTPLRRMPTRRLVCAAVWMLALAAAAPETYFLQVSSDEKSLSSL